MPTGIVTWADPEKGWGFITQDVDDDVFFYAADVTDPGPPDGASEPDRDDGSKVPTAAEPSGAHG